MLNAPPTSDVAVVRAPPRADVAVERAPPMSEVAVANPEAKREPRELTTLSI